MTRKEFMDILKDNLRGMSQEEKNDIIEYYEEYFEEAGPEKEAEVIAELGSPRNLGIRLSGEYAVRSLNGQGAANGSASAGQGNAAKQTSSGSVWKTVLIVMALIIGSPLILPAAIVAVVLILFSSSSSYPWALRQWPFCLPARQPSSQALRRSLPVHFPRDFWPSVRHSSSSGSASWACLPSSAS